MRKLIISAISLGIVGVALLAAAPAHAREYPWCLQMGGLAFPSPSFAMLGSIAHSDSGSFGGMLQQAEDSGGGRNCGFDTYEQCMAAKAGTGGFCERNLFYQDDPAPREGRPHDRSHRRNP